jgi:type III secretion protein N (ATPase)
MNQAENLTSEMLNCIEQCEFLERLGAVTEVLSNTIFAALPNASIGELCIVYKDKTQTDSLLGEVVSFEGDRAVISCLEPVIGVSSGALVKSLARPHQIQVHDGLLGMVLDGFGRRMGNSHELAALCLDRGGSPVIANAPNASDRPPIEEPMITGISVIDGVTTLGRGQRVGIFAGPGCGKSTLLAQIARGADVDVVVLGLVGERGRELREFIDREFDKQLVAKTVFVCATSDRSAIERVRASFTATAIAEKFRDEGKSVLLMIDSLTRLARAQREIGLMAGEPSARNGFTPSVYALLPTLIERSGRTPRGDITAIYTILLETNDISDDPIASEAKSLLDGHILLNRDLVQRGHFPAVDVLASLSRVMTSVTTREHQQYARAIREVYSRYKDVELLLRINEYQQGVEARNDLAIQLKAEVDRLLQQDLHDYSSLDQTVRSMQQIHSRLENA